ncbi:hypothetical protein KJ815_13510, partial [bacterium]|nr:hypothetical protein [bacterium]
MKKRRTRRRIAGLALAVILVSGCSLPEIPDGASWDTEIAVPLAQKTYALWEIADADSVIDAEGSGIGMTLPDSALYFSYYKDLEPIYPARSLRYDPIEHEIEARARGLRIPLDVEESRDLSLSVLNPTLANRHGTVTNVSPFAISVILQLAVSELFTAACVDSGDVQIRFRNTLPFAISAARLAWYADRVSEVRLYQGTLDAVQDTSYTMDLGGTCLAPTMTLEITGMAIGGQQVFIDSAQGLIVEIVMNDFIAATYTGIVPRQTMEADSSYPLEQQHDIFDADISEGELTITLTNNTPLVDSVRVLLPNLRIESGLPLTVTEALLPGQTREVRVNLAGFGFVVPEPARQEIDGWVESASIEMDHSVTYGGENLRTTARFRTSELRFRRFEGVVHDLETDIERDSSEVEDVPDGWENVHPAALDMRL